MSRIKQDHSRFRDIVRGKVRDNLKQYISNGELMGKQGGKAVKYPYRKLIYLVFALAQMSKEVSGTATTWGFIGLKSRSTR